LGPETRARLAFLGLLSATLLAYTQLFVAGTFMGPCLLGAALATGIVMAARKVGLGGGATWAASALALLWYLAVVFQSDRLLYGLPTVAALRGLGADLASAADASRVDFAPIPARPGYVALLVACFWIAAALGELATFSWRRPLLASLLPIGLTSLVLVVGTGGGASLWVSLFLIALLAFWGLESSHRLRSWGRWVAAWEQYSDEPQSVTGAVARRMGASCVAAAIIAPLLLPALDNGLLAWRTNTGSGVGTSGGGAGIDLLVSLAPTLVEQTDVELFRVAPDGPPTYWRLTSLSEFDGRDWMPSSATNVTPLIDGDVTTYEPPVRRYTKLTQRFRISALEDELLPAAVQPESIAFAETDGGSPENVAIDPDTGELRYEGRTFEGLTYEIGSHVPDVRAYRTLRNTPVGERANTAFTALPGGVSDRVRELLDRWTRDASTAFDELVAIQEHLRDFEYSTEVEREDSTDYLTQFLTETKRGFCQQFATAFAVLARLRGYPTRVSVGFLPGTRSPDDPDVYVVNGNQAHAWPEVYFEDFGWVPFEPTPRAEATEPLYTIPRSATLPGNRNGGEGPPSDETLLGNRFRDPGRTEDFVGPSRGAGRAGEGPGGFVDLAWARAFSRLARYGFIALLAFLVAVPMLKELRIRRLYRRSDGASGRARAAFAHFQREATELVEPRRRAESATAYAARIARANRAPRRAALGLASIYEAAEYGRASVSGHDASEATRLARQLRAALWSSASWWQRASRLFSPGGLLPRRAAS
jgi:transglutaminase-like putative cysteine protease